MTTVHKHSGATSRSAAMLYRKLSLCIRPSSPQPPAGGPGSPELALDDPEARSTLPGAACSMSQEPYDLTQKVSQTNTRPEKQL